MPDLIPYNPLLKKTKKEHTITEALTTTRYPEFIRTRDMFGERIVSVYDDIQSIEHLITPALRVTLGRWWNLAYDHKIANDLLAHHIEQTGGWDEEVLLVNPTTHTQEIISRHISPTDIARATSPLDASLTGSPDQTSIKQLSAHQKKLTTRFNKLIPVTGELATALEQLNVGLATLATIAEFVSWYHNVEPHTDDTNDMTLIREELRLALELVDVTPEGYAPGEEHDIAEVKDILNRQKNLADITRSTTEAVVRLKRLKLKIASDFNNIHKTVKTFERLAKGETVGAQLHETVVSATETYTNILQTTVATIDEILRTNNVHDLDLSLMETKLFDNVEHARNNLKTALDTAYQKQPTPTNRQLQTAYTISEQPRQLEVHREHKESPTTPETKPETA